MARSVVCESRASALRAVNGEGSFRAQRTDIDADVLVIGAGLSGLVAADRLATAGYRVVVLEAFDEVGGRTRSEQIGGVVADVGAEWVGRRHRYMLGLIRALGLRTEPARQVGYPVLWRTRGGASSLIPPVSAREGLAVLRLYAALARFARPLNPREPWRSPGAASHDAIDLGSWLRAHGVVGNAYYFFDRVIGALTSTPVERLSLLQVLWWVRRGGGPLRILWTTFERYLPGGAQQMALRLAERLGDAVVLGEAVTRISQDRLVEAETAGGRCVRARAAIVTAPLGTLQAITFDPPLPRCQQELDEIRIGPGTKVVGLLPAARVPLHRIVVGGQVLDGAWRVASRVTGFASPPASEAAEEALIADLARGFHVEPHELQATRVFRWSHRPHVPGCDVGFAPGQLCELGPHLREAHELIRFAGTERSSWPNNMEGAVESAVEVATALQVELG